MANIDKADFICDPFCGVGGFVLEPFQISSTLKKKFIPKGSDAEIKSGVRLLGYDTGREDSDEQKRTIILAKANMLIYLSDLIKERPDVHKAFSDLFNNTFHFLSDSNLGTLARINEFESEKQKPNLIITNPPYITSGVASIRREIDENGLTDDYKNSGKGVEGLCLKYIIKNLRRQGQAFIVLPDSIFNVFANKVLRDEIKKNCYINCIISLPTKTFFNTPKKTYVLGITKKDCDEDECENLKQDFPVFTYLVSNIGETLDINRFEIPENDLDNAKNLFNQFKGSPNSFQTDDPRCKLQPIEKFENEKYWIVDRWWNREEKEKLGVLEKEDILTIDEFKEEMKNVKQNFDELNRILGEL
jgi:type I restriction-modification system DNA methylase subunit